MQVPPVSPSAPPKPKSNPKRKRGRYPYRTPLLDHIEDVQRYVPGGYHPVDLGDTLTNGCDRYTIVHKLGYGGFSTVWLVKRERTLTPQPAGIGTVGEGETISFHALKILCSDVGDMAEDHEATMLQHLGQLGTSGHPNIVTLEASFTVSGPNGNHRCLVFPVLGPKLGSPQVNESMTPSKRHQVCRQLASAVACLHARRVCHGDLTPFNVVFDLPDIQSMPESDLQQLLGPINTEDLKLQDGSRSNHAPTKVVSTASLSGLDYSSLNSVRIIDFGQAFMQDTPPPTLGCPVAFFPVELCFGYPASPKSDIWQLANIIFMAHTNTFLFQVLFPVFESLVGFAVSCLGPIPNQWEGKFVWDRYGRREPGKPMDTSDDPWWFNQEPPSNALPDRLAKWAPGLSQPQRVELERLILDTVAWEPDARISAVEVARRLDLPVLSGVLCCEVTGCLP
ncbi:kinase-like domain-containing protein [Chaetomium sp. MPI-CAGE-AT-0009]|nr:kinase-like domain-containing protein [Chaetomium sp. MPI-CAGE-AT-0009]